MNSKSSSTLVMILLALVWSVSAVQAQDYDVVILNGRVIDPETNCDKVSHVGIKDGKIAKITDKKIKGKKTIDATGPVVSPGFIDLHAHGQNIGDYRMQTMQGVTSP